MTDFQVNVEAEYNYASESSEFIIHGDSTQAVDDLGDAIKLAVKYVELRSPDKYEVTAACVVEEEEPVPTE